MVGFLFIQLVVFGLCVCRDAKFCVSTEREVGKIKKIFLWSACLLNNE